MGITTPNSSSLFQKMASRISIFVTLALMQCTSATFDEPSIAWFSHSKAAVQRNASATSGIVAPDDIAIFDSNEDDIIFDLDLDDPWVDNDLNVRKDATSYVPHIFVRQSTLDAFFAQQ